MIEHALAHVDVGCKKTQCKHWVTESASRNTLISDYLMPSGLKLN